MIDRFLSLVVAVSLALLVWLYARSREQETLDNVAVPVQVMLAPRQAEQYDLELSGPNQVVLSFSGSPQRIRELQGMLQRKELHVSRTITVPDERLKESRYSDALVIEPSDVNAPPGITPLVSESRNRIPFTLHRLVERRLPVVFDNLREGPMGPIILDPPTVLVRGPREVLDRMQCIKTKPAELPSRPMHAPANVAAIGRVPLVDELEGRAVRVTPLQVLVRVPGQPRKLYELTDVPVQFLCPANFYLRPKFIDERAGKVTVKLLGPVQSEPPRVFAFIDLSKGRFVSGLNHEPLQLQVPKDFVLAQDPPRVVAFELLPGDFTENGLGVPATTTADPPAAPAPPGSDNER
jgi:hypothetical protein